MKIFFEIVCSLDDLDKLGIQAKKFKINNNRNNVTEI